MDRLETLRKHIDVLLLEMPDVEERRNAYIHLYGVAQLCTLIALKRGENTELATMAGMLHDIYSYVKMNHQDHAHQGSVLAREILTSLGLTNETETTLICDAIYTHGEKETSHTAFNEVLIDADVLQHGLYNPTFAIQASEKARYEKLKTELGMTRDNRPV